MPDRITKELLRRYFRNELSYKESKAVEKYLSDEKGDGLLGTVLDEDWEQVSQQKFPEENAYFTSFTQKYVKKDRRQTWEAFSSSRFFKNPAVWRYAAIWILTVLTYTFFHTWRQPVERGDKRSLTWVEKSNPRGLSSIVLLPDSSKVYLGAESCIRFAREMKGKTREVVLKGEAFFEITSGRRPFVVSSGNIRTTVLGTSFKVEAFEGSKISVGVATGKVRISSNSKPGAVLSVLRPGQKIIWDPLNASMEKIVVPVSHLLAWKNGGLIFRNQTLKDICLQLERRFDTRINIRDSLSYRHMSASFGRVSLNEMLDVLAYTGKFNYTIKDRNIIIRKKMKHRPPQ